MSSESNLGITVNPAQAKTISELALIIAEQTAKIERYHAIHGLPSPSLDAGPGLFPPPYFPPDIERAREILIDATDELQVRVYGSTPFLFRQLTNRHNEQVSLHVITKFNICGAIPLGEERSYGDIAKTCGLDEDDVRRTIRHAIANHIFISPRPGFVAHNGPSQVLAESSGLRATLQHGMEDMVPSMSHLAFALQKYPGSQDPTQTGFNLAYQTNDSFFEHISKSKYKSDNFHQAMTFFSSGPGFQTSHVVKSFDWAGLGPDAVVVDVGGSNGLASKALTEAFPNLTCIVQDRPEGLGNAATTDIEDKTQRLRFMAHNFFDEQPVKNANVYFLRLIFHDWSDEYCKKILRALGPALGRSSKIIINDFCVPDLVPQASSAFRDLTCMDMAMKASMNGRERNQTEWSALVEAADPRYKVTSFIQAPDSKLSLIVCEWKE